VLNTVLFPLAVALAIFANETVLFLLGPKWASAGPILAILALSLPFRSTQRLCAATARAVGAPWWVAFCQFVYIAMVALGAGLGSRWGLSGVAAGVGLAIFGQFAALATVVSRRADVSLLAIVRAHAAAVPLTVTLGGIALIGKWLLAPYLATWATLLTLLVCAVLIAGSLILALPKLILGQHGCWLAARMLGAVPAALQGFAMTRIMRQRFRAHADPRQTQ
jgi:PST family polysaccharide transporter